jgi:hypothetical protein
LFKGTLALISFHPDDHNKWGPPSAKWQPRATGSGWGYGGTYGDQASGNSSNSGLRNSFRTGTLVCVPASSVLLQRLSLRRSCRPSWGRMKGWPLHPDICRRPRSPRDYTKGLRSDLPVTARRSRACCRGSLARLIFGTGAAPSGIPTMLCSAERPRTL